MIMMKIKLLNRKEILNLIEKGGANEHDISAGKSRKGSAERKGRMERKDKIEREQKNDIHYGNRIGS
jgi:hypothetical protein